ncbi:hypothetical protein BPY_13200 [Bifidobacterium psychraerophilum]
MSASNEWGRSYDRPHLYIPGGEHDGVGCRGLSASCGMGAMSPFVYILKYGLLRTHSYQKGII